MGYVTQCSTADLSVYVDDQAKHIPRATSPKSFAGVQVALIDYGNGGSSTQVRHGGSWELLY